MVKLNHTERKLLQRDNAPKVVWDMQRRNFDNWKKHSLDPRPVSRNTRTLQNAAHRRVALMDAHLGWDLPLCTPQLLVLVWDEWALGDGGGQALREGRAVVTTHLAVWQCPWKRQTWCFCLVLFPCTLRGLCSSWGEEFFALIWWTHKSLPKHLLGRFSLRDLWTLPYISGALAA